MKPTLSTYLVALVIASVIPVYAASTANTMDPSHSQNAGDMNHSASMGGHTAGMDHNAMMGNTQTNSPALTEAGNDAFGTIQEAIVLLQSDPETDWNMVNLEALRLHLLDMEDMTFNVDVLSQTNTDNGMIAVLKATTMRADNALKRIFEVHPMQLNTETGWQMVVTRSNGEYTLTTTTDKPGEISMIRGLGYIGWMAYGNHHQPHHLSMAKGKNPHDQMH